MCIGEIEVIQFLLRFYVYSSLVAELQENVNLQVVNGGNQGISPIFQITYHNILKMNIGLSKYESTSATCATTNNQ